MYFKVLMEMGRGPTGISYDIVRYFEAEDAITLLTQFENYTGLKPDKFGVGIKLVQAVSKENYKKWKKEQNRGEAHTRLHPRHLLDKKCILENTYLNGLIDSTLTAATVDYSINGIRIKYTHKQIDKGTRLLLSVDSLNIKQKEAKIIWSNFCDGVSSSGLQWLNS